MDIHSITREDRQLMPFLDRLDLDGLMSGAGNEGAGALAQGLPGALPSGVPRPVAEAPGPAAMQGEALMPVKAPEAPAESGDGFALPHGGGGPVEAGAMAGSHAGAAAGHGARPGAIHGSHGNGSADDGPSFSHGPPLARPPGGPGQDPRGAPDPTGKDGVDPDGDRSDEPHIRASIDQDVAIDQDADVDVVVSGASGAQVDAVLVTEVSIDQSAVIDLDIDTGRSGGALPLLLPARGGLVHQLDIDEVDVDNSQDIDIDSEVSVFVRGFAGEVFVRTLIEEDAEVTQAARPVIILDGDDEGFDIDISQFLDIDVLSDIDIDISEDGGRLYITVSVKDSVSSQDEALVALQESNDDILDIELRQAVDVDQKLVVHVDIEQELASLFDVTVDVDADMDVDIRQDAEAGIDIDARGEVDIDIDGDSQVNVSNQLQIRIDFTHA